MVRKRDTSMDELRYYLGLSHGMFRFQIECQNAMARCMGNVHTQKALMELADNFGSEMTMSKSEYPDADYLNWLRSCGCSDVFIEERRKHYKIGSFKDITKKMGAMLRKAIGEPDDDEIINS